MDKDKIPLILGIVILITVLSFAIAGQFTALVAGDVVTVKFERPDGTPVVDALCYCTENCRCVEGYCDAGWTESGHTNSRGIWKAEYLKEGGGMRVGCHCPGTSGDPVRKTAFGYSVTLVKDCEIGITTTTIISGACTDSDGLNFKTKGYVMLDGQKHWDSCYSSNSVKECVCTPNGDVDCGGVFNCQAYCGQNYRCVDGRCISDVPPTTIPPTTILTTINGQPPTTIPPTTLTTVTINTGTECSNHQFCKDKYQSCKYVCKYGYCENIPMDLAQIKKDNYCNNAQFMGYPTCDWDLSGCEEEEKKCKLANEILNENDQCVCREGYTRVVNDCVFTQNIILATIGIIFVIVFVIIAAVVVYVSRKK